MFILMQRLWRRSFSTIINILMETKGTYREQNTSGTHEQTGMLLIPLRFMKPHSTETTETTGIRWLNIVMRSHEWIKATSCVLFLHIHGNRRSKVQLVSSGSASSFLNHRSGLKREGKLAHSSQTPLIQAVYICSHKQRGHTNIQLTFSRSSCWVKENYAGSRSGYCVCMHMFVRVLRLLLCDECCRFREERAPLDHVNTWFIAVSHALIHILYTLWVYIHIPVECAWVCNTIFACNTHFFIFRWHSHREEKKKKNMRADYI